MIVIFRNMSRRKMGSHAEYKGVLAPYQYEQEKNSYILVFDKKVLKGMEVQYTIDPRDWDLIAEPLGKSECCWNFRLNGFGFFPWKRSPILG